jgi:hypothetical protein
MLEVRVRVQKDTGRCMLVGLGLVGPRDDA